MQYFFFNQCSILKIIACRPSAGRLGAFGTGPSGLRLWRACGAGPSGQHRRQACEPVSSKPMQPKSVKLDNIGRHWTILNDFWNPFGDFLPHLVWSSLEPLWRLFAKSGSTFPCNPLELLGTPLATPLQPSLQPLLEPPLEPSGSTFLGTPLGNPQNPLVALSLETLRTLW